MRASERGIFWLGLYLVLALAPLGIVFLSAALGERPPEPRDFWTEFSVALGFIGLAMMGLQFALTARFRRVQAPYGIDIIYHFHKRISLVAFAMVLAHPVLLVAVHFERYSFVLNPFTAPWPTRAAWTATILLILLVVTSVWRQALRLSYETWRIMHGIFAIGIIAFAYWHVLGIGPYLELLWQQVLWAAMGVSVVSLTFYTRIVKPITMIRKPWIVEEVRAERGDSWTLALRAQGHPGMRFHPGQFGWLTIGRSPLAIQEHPFSFSSSAERSERVEFTIKSLGDFTRTVKDILRGAMAHIDGPYGVFSCDRYHSDDGYVFIAGGIGITPIMSMMRTLADRGDLTPQLLIYANRSREDVIFWEELEEMNRQAHVEVVHVLEDAPELWPGETGFVTSALLEQYLPKERAARHCFVCGPPAMLDAVREALLATGVPLTHIHMEQFELV